MVVMVIVVLALLVVVVLLLVVVVLLVMRVLDLGVVVFNRISCCYYCYCWPPLVMF